VPPESSRPLVTVVIPSYNRERFVTDAIDSVLQQDHADIELIIIDDGSTDGSVRRIGDHLAARSPSIRVDFQARQNRGKSATLNTGLTRAKGRYFSLLDSDDVLEPGMVRTLATALGAAGAETAASFGDGWVVDPVGRVQGRLSDTAPYRGGNVFMDLARLRFFPLIQSSLIRRHVLEQLGGFDERFKLLDDWDMWLRLTRRYEIAYVPSPVVRYRIHPENRSSTELERFRDEARTVVKEVLAREADLGPHARSIRAQLEARLGALYYNVLRMRQARNHAASALRLSPGNELAWTVLLRSLLGATVVERLRASRRRSGEPATRQVAADQR
jgi:glycosyltransferase involved in cell wall biosynthesis